MTCKTCKWLNVPPDKRGRIVVRDTGYRCAAPIPERPALPVCITRSYSFREWPATGDAWTSPKLGADCPLHEPRVRP